MAQKTILITGASSGLGLAFTKHYATLPTTKTILALDNTHYPHPNPPPTIQSFQIDVPSEDALRYMSLKFAHEPISLIIHCAGVRGLVPRMVKSKRGDVAAAETLEVMDSATMMRAFEINTWGSFNVVRAFVGNLKLAAAAAAARGEETGGEMPKVVLLSSRMGSVSANVMGGGYAYRASKAALNAVVKSLVVDVPEVLFLMLHPGRVETGLVEWKEEGAISVDESLRDCLRVIENTKESGKLVDRFGVDIPW